MKKKTISGWTIKPTYTFSTYDKKRDLCIWRELRLYYGGIFRGEICNKRMGVQYMTLRYIII